MTPSRSPRRGGGLNAVLLGSRDRTDGRPGQGPLPSGPESAGNGTFDDIDHEHLHEVRHLRRRLSSLVRRRDHAANSGCRTVNERPPTRPMVNCRNGCEVDSAPDSLGCRHCHLLPHQL